MSDLAATGRQIARLREAGAIPDETARAVLRQLSARRAALGAGHSSGPAEVPVATPTPSASSAQSPPDDVPVAELVKPVSADSPARPTAQPPKVPATGQTPLPLPPAQALPQPPTRPAPPAPVPVVQRTPAPQPAAPAPHREPAPTAPRRSWGQMLEAFMEERNMRWGELIGGLLIVGGGIALAVTLRETLQSVPYSQFLLFAAVAVLVYGVGLYAHHYWRLANTSRGLLVIGLLLTPLSFLIMADLSEQGGLALRLAVQGASLGVFGGLAWLAVRPLVPAGPRLAVLGVLGNSAVMLVLAQLAPPGLSIPWIAAAGCGPVALFAAVVVFYLLRLGRRRDLEAADAVGLLTLLGTAAFAMALVEGYLVARAVRALGLAAMADSLAPATALAAAPLVAAGFALVRGLRRGAALEGYRAVGTTVALVGGVAMLAALAMAWPQPAAMIAVGVLDAAVSAWIAFRYRLPVAHAGVIFSVTMVALVGYHTVGGDLADVSREAMGEQLLRLITSAPSGDVLGVLLVASAAAAGWLARRGRRRHARVYAGGCGVLALAGLSLVTWHGAGGGADALRATVHFGLYGLVSVGLALRWRRATLSYLGLALLQAATLWALWWRGLPLRPGLLGFATAAALVGEALRVALRRGRAGTRRDVRRVLLEPLRGAALTASAAVLPWLAVKWPVEAVHLAIDLYWVAAVWLLVAFRARLAGLLSAAQVALGLATVAAATAWLQRESWPWIDPPSVQAYALALGLLGLAWAIVRIALERNRTARFLLNPPWPAVDRAVQHAVVLGQLLFIVGSLLPGIHHELLTPAGPQDQVDWIVRAVGPGAWGVLGVLALGSLGSLWLRFGERELVAGLLVLLALPWLVAGRWADERAVGSALRWALGAGFVLGSTLVWARRPLGQRASAAGVRLDLSDQATRLARGLLVAGTALPVVAVTLLAAALQLGGTLPGGPAVGSFFDWLGPQWSYLVPLVLVVVGLVGHALRETSAPYAFAAGLVVEMAVVLGCLLGAGTLGEEELLRTLQWATLAAAVWAGLWLFARRWTAAWAEGDDETAQREAVPRALSHAPQRSEPSPAEEPLVASQQEAQKGTVPFSLRENRDSPQRENRDSARRVGRALMSVQMGLAIAGNAVLILPAVVTLALVSRWYDDWAIVAGEPLGWAALVATVVVLAWRGRRAGRRLSPDLVGLAGMTTLALAACTVQGFCRAWPLVDQPWGFRVLMLGWAIYSAALAMAAWWVASLRTTDESVGPPQALVRSAAVWVRAAGLLAVALGLKSALVDGESLWGATAIALASVAGAVMAVWRRREGWAFSAALGVNLAASLAVWHFRDEFPPAWWWITLVQANLIASAAVALVWLAALRRLYQLRELSVGASPLLALQTAWPSAALAALCSLVPLDLLADAQRMSGMLGALAAPPGWLALALVTAAAGWYWLRLSLRNLPHVLALVGLEAASLAACAMTDALPWQAYHVLLVTLSAVGGFVLLAGVAAGRLGKAEWFPPSAVHGWVLASAGLVFVLTVVHAGEDPASPGWPGAVLLVQSAVLGVLGVWRRDAVCVCLSGLLPCVIATIASHVWYPDRIEMLFELDVAAIAAASIVWSLVALAMPWRVPMLEMPGSRLRFAHLASQGALGLFVLTAAWRTLYAALELEHAPVAWTAWTAWGALVGSIVVLLWDRAARLAVPGLYLAVFAGVGLALDARGLAGREFCLAAMADLAAFGVGAAVLGAVIPRLNPLWRALGIHDDRVHWPYWFTNSQTIVVALVAGTAAWVALDVEFEGLAYSSLGPGFGRRLAPAAMAAAVFASLVMSVQMRRALRIDWQVGTLVLVGLLLATTGWAWLAPDDPAPWLHRGAILMTMAVAMTLLAGAIVPRVLGPRRDWSRAGRRATPALAATALVALGLVLAGEVALQLHGGNVPMALWAKLAVGAALVGLAIGCVVVAVVPGRDPLGLSLRGRTAYIYAAEALLAVLCLHVRLVFPELFRLGLVRKYWMFLVMAVAFGGAWLAEWFERRRMAVLSEPLGRTALLLPLAPAALFWFLGKQSPLAQTMMGPGLWFLIGLFYGTLAVVRRSWWLAALAVAAGNVGLWVLWDRWEMNFIDHPQLWLIPISLCALVAEYLHHDRLSPSQSAGLRYFTLAVIYVSSTTEFLRGVGESIWLPVILVGLSVLGALAGILLRVQSFLYVGVTFLVVVLLRMILYAAFEQDHIWVFWLFIIALGTAVLGLVGLFEKRRDDVLARVRRLREWQK